MDNAGVPLSVRVVEAVAAARGVDETALPPLSEAIDADALDAMFTDVDRDALDGPTVGPILRFRYAGRLVVVRGSGAVDVREPE